MSNFLIAGNWKMNCGPSDAKSLSQGLAERWPAGSFECEVVVSPPSISIPTVIEALQGSEIQTSAQNVHEEDGGAFTGDISVPMVKDAGCSHVIVGHSERREYYGETNSQVADKARKVVSESLTAIVCVGEKLDQRKEGTQEKVVMEQLDAVFNKITIDQASQLVIAYEPVWAIGTGETASPEQAQEMHLFIRNLLTERWNEERSGEVKILYGGSMKPANARELLSQKDVDGGLIGGASLQVDSFSGIIEIAEDLS
ncbi:MAG: triose-phosphate isomerase [Balneolaceae bacterium]